MHSELNIIYIFLDMYLISEENHLKTLKRQKGQKKDTLEK